MTNIVVKFKGKVTYNQREASHIITSIPPQEPDGEWLRAIERYPDNQTLVHWWYLPDSYDVFVDSQKVSDPEIVESRDLVWKVNGRFIIDLEVYHEWMNEEDYEEDLCES
eukprot:Pgem_evm1s5709